LVKVIGDGRASTGGCVDEAVEDDWAKLEDRKVRMLEMCTWLSPSSIGRMAF
jgi:hypothetical protein